ncbi:GntR family transcriptional regulator [Clostridium beijerinckii]|nr:GntR family transcriptional regulator [Clostridium beijerinckii]MRY42767.1 FCD domain-containing protein [Parabacteroides distasonis]MZK52078.1 FCD domain-containing protein [Clostridium beijerinckii]MZK60219.1 FCD domain-containing protein [Clostridium beijerinckii]MZK70504.1 FCD domain-containing protein [Clostridium beijerinckii]MZK75806.1 FCD domain-containing protein [Clostridium beijerinckii]
MPRVRGNTVDIAVQKILHKIENYELVTGDIVSDLELSKEFEMSRTPMREAIMILLDNGILERTKTKVVVKAITLNDINEILEVREAIEQMSVEIIINNKGLTKAQLKELNVIQEKLCENITNGNFDSNFEADAMFHEKLAEYSGNERFLDICKRIYLQSQRLRWITMLTPSRYTETCEEHQKIIDALTNLDLSVAKEAIHSHLQNSKSNYDDIINNKQWNKIAQQMKNMRL